MNQATFVEGAQLIEELDEEYSLYDGSGSVVTEVEDLDGHEPNRRDEGEKEAHSAAASEGDEIPHP